MWVRAAILAERAVTSRLARSVTYLQAKQSWRILTTRSSGASEDGAAHAGKRSHCRSAAIRLHHHVPLHFSPTHDGTGAADPDYENGGAADGRFAMGPRGAFLGEDFRNQLRDRRGDRHSDGISVRHELGRIFKVSRRGDRTNAGDGRRIFVFPGVEFS